MRHLYRVMRFIYSHPLNRQQRLSSLMRFLRWQCATRIMDLEVIVPFINNTRLIAEKGITCGSGTYYVGLVEPDEMIFTLHYLRPKDLFVDVGANIGVFTVLAAGAVGARCISIEPIPKTYQRLLDNVNINCLNDHVQAINAGLGDKIGRLHFTSDRDSINHVATELDATRQPVEVNVTTLDHVTQNQLPEMIKIDVEGFESAVISGGRQLLRGEQGPNVILMELRGHGSRYGFDEETVHKDMLGYAYRPYVYDFHRRELHPWQRKTENTLGDMLYIRDVEKAQYRIDEAPTFTVAKRVSV